MVQVVQCLLIPLSEGRHDGCIILGNENPTQPTRYVVTPMHKVQHAPMAAAEAMLTCDGPCAGQTVSSFSSSGLDICQTRS